MDRRNFGKAVLGARGMLSYNRMDLASRAGVGHETLARAERGDETVSRNTLAAIQRALEEAGIEFPEGTVRPSVRLRADSTPSGCGVIADPTMPSGTRFQES